MSQRQPEMSRRRAGFVHFQQALAREAICRGSLGAARAALRILRPADFAADPAVSERLLSVVRNGRSTDDELRDALRALIELEPTDH